MAEKVNATLTVERVSSVCQGCVPWESKKITLVDDANRTYIWWGGNADTFETRRGDRVQVAAYINPKTGNLKSVKAINLGDA